jgi:DNA end-binding protein Ku
MARAIWQGSISFGLVEIPVLLLPAERPHELKLSMIDRRDFAPVGYVRYNKKTDEEVPWEEIVRAYEYEKDQYVVLTDQDLEHANPELTRTVDILRFVDRDEIEPIYYDKPYFLGPTKKHSKGYVLLRETLERTRAVGIARIVIRTREHIAALSVHERVLVLYLLRYPDEVRSTQDVEHVDVGLKDVGVGAKEVEMATRLVEGMRGKWNPDDYSDEYKDDLMNLIEKKVKSGNLQGSLFEDVDEPRRARKDAGKVLDLMPLLKKSLEVRAGRPTAARRSVRSPGRSPGRTPGRAPAKTAPRRKRTGS